jgi:hypothetical protein
MAVTHDPPLSWYWYAVIGELPAAGALNETRRNVFPAVMPAIDGADGFASGVTATRGEEASPTPATFVAVTDT